MKLSACLHMLLLASTAVFAQDPELPIDVTLYGNSSKPSSVGITCQRQENRSAECWIKLVEINTAPGVAYRDKRLAEFDASKEERLQQAFRNRDQYCTDGRLEETRDLIDSQRTGRSRKLLEEMTSAFSAACSAHDLPSFSAAMTRTIRLEIEQDSNTCKLRSTTRHLTFEYQGLVEDGFWYYRGKPDIGCGAFRMATIRKSGGDWAYDERIIVTNPDGKSSVYSCNSLDTKPRLFVYRGLNVLRRFALECPYMEIDTSIDWTPMADW